MKTIYEKELLQYFHSMIGYVFLAIFLMISGYYFLAANLLGRSGDIADYFQSIVQILIFLIPLLTMRSFSEEKRQKTDILLCTSARRVTDIVFGKYLAAMTVFGMGVLATALFPVILSFCGSSQIKLTLGCFLGLILLMGAFIAIGIFVSSLTENQIVAAVGTYLIIFLMWYSYGFGSSIQNQQLLKLLNRLSLMNLYYELVMGVLNPSGIAVLLSVIAVFLFLTCVFSERLKKPRALTVVLFLGVIVTGNILIYTAVNRFALTGDLTKGKLFLLSETTRDLLRELEAPVTITYFDEEKGSDTNISELLKRYEKYGPNVEVRYVDLQANPAMASEYDEKGLNLSDNGILVESGDNARALSWSELYGYNSYTGGDGKIHYTLTSFKAEAKITSAISQVTGETLREVFFTEGHGENANDSLKELVQDAGYLIRSGVPAVEGLSDDCDAVIIAGPERDFSAQELDLLEKHMENGGKLLVFRNPSAGSLQGLDGFLAEWGLKADGTAVLEPSRQMDNPLHVIPDFAVHMINVYFSEHSSYLVLPLSGSLTLSDAGGALTAPVLKSTSGSYSKDLSQALTTEREEGDPSGPFVLAATSEKTTKSEDGTSGKACVFLIDCSDFYSEQLLSNASLGNCRLILQTLAWMNDEGESLHIPEKSLSNTQIAISWSATLAFGIVFIGVLPALLILTGLIVFVRRRRA